MRQRLRLLAYYASFWITFQIIIRAIFLLYNSQLTKALTAGEILKIFWNGLRMDFSIAGYFMMLTSLLFVATVFVQERWLYVMLHTISITLIILSSIIAIVDIELYRHWGFRLDTTPFFYIAGAETEAAGSVEVSVVIKLFLLLTALVTIALFAYSTWLMPNLKLLEPTQKKKALVFLLIAGLMIIPIRGSFSVAPMNSGFVYFHKTNAYANHAAINVIWNFVYSLSKSSKLKYDENFFDKGKAQEYFQTFYPSSDSTYHLFSTPRPNVILFILESFTADAIEPLGGTKNLTPNLNRLAREGILFDNFYSSGDRTDKGVVSVLSAYPAQPLNSISKFPAKTEKLSYLTRAMNDLGYNSSFYYGGDINFANFRSYLTNCQFNNLITYDDFNSDDGEPSKWGYHDHLVLNRALREIDSTHSPFFKVILTLSSHEPFDVPMEPIFKTNHEDSLFLNSIHYTDRSIGTFIDSAKKSNWWSNTVILFVADHGHRQPGNKELKDKKRFRIPFIISGGAIKKDTVISTFAGQTDIANTLLAQIDKPRQEFRFSKNILSPNAKSFAFYFFNNGYGYVSPDNYIVYDHTAKRFLEQGEASEQVLNETRAYQQIIFSDFNAK
ncbi:MAG TPA: sulfatase-like hydrolase/transferase [Chryseosolibacter sp.]